MKDRRKGWGERGEYVTVQGKTDGTAAEHNLHSCCPGMLMFVHVRLGSRT